MLEFSYLFFWPEAKKLNPFFDVRVNRALGSKATAVRKFQ
jgi:hypothetical protein